MILKEWNRAVKTLEVAFGRVVYGVEGHAENTELMLARLSSHIRRASRKK